MGGDFYFSKIETFDEDELLNQMANKKNERKKERRNRKLENLGIFVGKSSFKTLKKAEKFNEYTSELEAKNPEVAFELNQRKAWQLASLKAQGVKVKADISKIRKSVQKSKKNKYKSSKKWTDRIEKTMENRDLKQKKRERNLRMRHDAKRAKKYKKLVKKGHILPELPKE
uniref:SURF6 domain-containing protein n=1 Tax=Mesocestoides corti TaxID=53468 RepID=A0A5K3FTS9_MESCO